jgi:hypothetical protein
MNSTPRRRPVCRNLRSCCKLSFVRTPNGRQTYDEEGDLDRTLHERGTSRPPTPASQRRRRPSPRGGGVKISHPTPSSRSLSQPPPGGRRAALFALPLRCLSIRRAGSGDCIVDGLAYDSARKSRKRKTRDEFRLWLHLDARAFAETVRHDRAASFPCLLCGNRRPHRLGPHRPGAAMGAVRLLLDDGARLGDPGGTSHPLDAAAGLSARRLLTGVWLAAARPLRPSRTGDGFPCRSAHRR